MKEIKVTNCKDCPFLHIETYEHPLCNLIPLIKIDEKNYKTLGFPATIKLNGKKHMSYELDHKLDETISPKCPLIKEMVTVQIDNNFNVARTEDGKVYLRLKDKIPQDDLNNLEFKQQALQDYMSFLSEDFWCAGWLIDLEYILWEQLMKYMLLIGTHNPKYALDSFDLSTKQLQKLKWHVDEANCWFIWDHNKLDAVPIKISDWRELYIAWKHD